MYKLSDTLEVTHNKQTRIEFDIESWTGSGIKKVGLVQITIESEHQEIMRELEKAIRRQINKIRKQTTKC